TAPCTTDVAVADGAEQPRAARRGLAQIGHAHLVAPPARLGCLLRIPLERGDLPALPGQQLRQEAVSRADVESAAPSPVAQGAQNDRVTRIWIGLELVDRGGHPAALCSSTLAPSPRIASTSG